MLIETVVSTVARVGTQTAVELRWENGTVGTAATAFFFFFQRYVKNSLLPTVHVVSILVPCCEGVSLTSYSLSLSLSLSLSVFPPSSSLPHRNLALTSSEKQALRVIWSIP